MSVIRFAAKFTVRWRKARADASQISGSGGPAPNGCSVLSKVGSSGRDGVAKTLLIWRLLILIRDAQGARGGEKMSKHSVPGGDFAGLMKRFAQLQEKAKLRTGQSFRIIVVQEAGLDGFWIHRALQNEGIESHVVDAASIATSRRRRRAKTDKIDGETLVRVLLAYKRGEPRVCAVLKVPTPDEEDRRHLCRERKALTAERVRHVNRIKGFLFSQGVSGYQPLHRDRRQRLEELQTGDGRAFPQHLKALVNRELDRLELLLKQ